MKLLTTEQLRAVLDWYESLVLLSGKLAHASSALDALITAECRNHGFAGIEDAYQVLIEKEGK